MLKKLKILYNKPSVQYAIKSILLGGAQHFARELGYELVKMEKVKTETIIKEEGE